MTAKKQSRQSKRATDSKGQITTTKATGTVEPSNSKGTASTRTHPPSIAHPTLAPPLPLKRVRRPAPAAVAAAVAAILGAPRAVRAAAARAAAAGAARRRARLGVAVALAGEAAHARAVVRVGGAARRRAPQRAAVAVAPVGLAVGLAVAIAGVAARRGVGRRWPVVCCFWLRGRRRAAAAHARPRGHQAHADLRAIHPPLVHAREGGLRGRLALEDDVRRAAVRVEGAVHRQVDVQDRAVPREHAAQVRFCDVLRQLLHNDLVPVSKRLPYVAHILVAELCFIAGLPFVVGVFA